jgi:hypothetical protein
MELGNLSRANQDNERGAAFPLVRAPQMFTIAPPPRREPARR